MGLSSQFIVGSYKELLNGVSQGNYGEVQKLIEKEADFSLHLMPKDLQTLFDYAAMYTSLPLPPFRGELECYFDCEDRGYFIVSDRWVVAMSTLDVNLSKELATKWFEKMAEIYQDQELAIPTPETEKAVHDLIALCKYAVKYSKPLLHIWFA